MWGTGAGPPKHIRRVTLAAGQALNLTRNFAEGGHCGSPFNLVAGAEADDVEFGGQLTMPIFLS